jgi:hypothetical protein
MLFRKSSNWLIVALLCVLPAAAQTVVRAGTTAVPWASSISCSPGQFVAASPDNLHVFKAVNTTPGTAANTQPTWNIFSGAITVDGSCAWQEQGTLGLPGSGGTQSGPPQTLTNCTAAGTTLNEGVQFSTQLISGVTSLCGTTAAAGSISVVGVCQTGCGNAGAAQIAYSGYQPGIFDNQTTQNDYVIPSATNPGQFTDIGATVPASTTENVGIVASTNTGPGTIATIFLAPLSLLARGSSGGSGVVNPPGCANGVAYYPGLGAVISSDCFFTTNGSGDFTAHSGTFNDASHAGYINIIQGPAPPAAPANGVQVSVPTSVTGYIMQLPGATGTGCLQANAITGGFQIAPTGVNCGTGSGVTLQTNAVNNASQALLNNTNDVGPMGTTTVFSNPSGGIEKLTVTPQRMSTPAAPTLANNNAAGARSITYLIQACEDINCTNHTLQSATATIANANASPQVLLSGYSVYGARCYNVYVTADSGGRATGKIASCVGKKYIDTAVAGDATSPTNTNTTELFSDTPPLPGAANPLASPHGVDAPPSSPNALDDEFTELNPTIGGANDGVWTWVNQSSAATTLTGGMLSLTAPTRGTGTAHSQINCLFQTAPATPYTAKLLNYSTATINGSFMTYIALRESATGKIITLGWWLDGGVMGKVIGVKLTDPTNTGTFTGYVGNGTGATSSGFTLYAGNDGANIFTKYSNDGVVPQTALSEAKNTFFTTAPDQIGICIETPTGAGIYDIDYFRVTSP